MDFEKFKKIVFFIFFPIFLPIGVFMFVFQPQWEKLSESKEKTDRFFYYLLAPIFFPLAGFLFLLYGPWYSLWED